MTSQTYNLDGPKEFPFPHPVRSADQLTVEIVPGAAVAPGDYEVVGVGPTSTQVTVRYPNAPTSGGLQLKITRYVAPERVTQIDSPSDINVTNLNAEFNNVYEALTDFESYILDLVQTEVDAAIAAKDAAQLAAQEAEAAWDAFRDQYWGAYASDPSTSPLGNPPDEGDLYWNTTANQWRVWNGSAWQQPDTAVGVNYDRQDYVAEEGQTTFAATYDAGFVQVWINGALLPPSDYEASSGTDVVLAEGVPADTEVTVIGLGATTIDVLDGDAAQVSTSTGTQLLPAALDSRVVHVPDIAALRALTGVQDGQAVRMTTTGRSGDFYFDGSDLSTEVTADPQSGIYVAPDSDPTGASGAWVRQFGQAVNYYPKILINWFGAVGDDDGTGVGTDNTAAINAAAALYRYWVKFINPNGPSATHNPHYEQNMCLGARPGAYYCSGSLNFSTNDGDYADGVKNIEFDLGAIIVSGAAGRAAVDLCGAFGGRYNNLSVFGLPSSRPAVGVLCARTGIAEPNPSAGAHNFSGLHVIGEYAVSAIYEYGSEINRYDSSCFFNNKTGICTIYETADNQAQAISSDFCTVDTTYQSSYGSVFMGPIILWSGNDQPGAEGLIVIEAMSFGPKFVGCYGDMQQGAVNKRPYFVFSPGGQTNTSANIQAPGIIDCQFENDFDSLVEIRTRVNELRIQGCAMPTAATTADINVTATGSLYAPDIQKYRGGTTLGQMEWLVDPSATVTREVLAQYPLDNVTGNYVTESSLTLDGTFYELDVGADLGIPSNVKFIDVRVETRLTGTPGGANFFRLRGAGETVSAKEAIFQPQVDGVSLYQEAQVPVYGGKIEYNGAAGLTRARVLIRGYSL